MHDDRSVAQIFMGPTPGDGWLRQRDLL